MTHFKLPRSAFIGFDNIFDELDKLSNATTDNYPPHNILKLSENKYAIELAVVGFKESDLELNQQDGILHVIGDKASTYLPTDYLHRGISGRSFKRSFRLSEHVEVKGANLRDGLLVIELERVIPQEKRPRLIPINQHVENTHDTYQNNPQFLSERSQQHA